MREATGRQEKNEEPNVSRKKSKPWGGDMAPEAQDGDAGLFLPCMLFLQDPVSGALTLVRLERPGGQRAGSGVSPGIFFWVYSSQEQLD